MSFTNFTFVTSRLATGGGPATIADIADLIAKGITHVIDCRETLDPISSGVKTLFNPTPDDGQYKPVEWFAKSIAFALPVLLNRHNKLYVHCDAGINRGPSTCYCILRAWTGMFQCDAYSLVITHRPIDLFGLRYAGDAEVALSALGYS